MVKARLNYEKLCFLTCRQKIRIGCIVSCGDATEKEDLSIFVIGNGQDNLPARVMEKVDNFLHDL